MPFLENHEVVGEHSNIRNRHDHKNQPESLQPERQSAPKKTVPNHSDPERETRESAQGHEYNHRKRNSERQITVSSNGERYNGEAEH